MTARDPRCATPAAIALASLPGRALAREMLRGATPSPDALVGWEHRGLNTRWASTIGIRKFLKGFVRDRHGVLGYNAAVVQNGRDEPWSARPDDRAPRRFGYFRVAPVDPTARDNRYLHALLLDYGAAPHAVWDATRGLRDYLVAVDDGLYLGRAYYALGPARVATSYFVLERHRAVTPAAP